MFLATSFPFENLQCDILATMDEAVSDGADIISLSVGANGHAPDFYRDSIEKTDRERERLEARGRATNKEAEEKKKTEGNLVISNLEW